MTIQPRRRFTLLDAMVLVAATAVVFAYRSGFDFLRFWVGAFSDARDVLAGTPSTRLGLARAGALVPFLLWPPQLLLSGWTLALVGLRLVPPRPRRRRLATQPGAVACRAVSLVLVAEAALAATLLLGLTPWLPLSIKVIQETGAVVTSGDGFRAMTPRAAWAVAASWLVLAMGGRWRPEPDWIDRAGRVVGYAWIATIPLYSWVIVHRG